MNLIILQTLQTLWFYVPAMLANMAPIAVQDLNLLPSLLRPLDGGKSWRGKRIFGDHKTVRGMLAGLVVGGLAGYGQYVLSAIPAISFISIAPHSDLISAVVIGLLSGIGALGGDAIKSFFKRRLNIAAGKSWALFDQIDFIIGATLTAGWFAQLTATHILIALLIIGLGSYITSVIGVRLHIKESL